MTNNSSRPRASEPVKFVPKGWGFEKWIVNCDEYCGKILFLAKGKQCSWHFHKKKDEVFYLQSGKILLYFGYDKNIDNAETIILEKGDKFHVPIGLNHRMHALLDSEVFEFSTEHFDEDSNRIIPGD